MPFPKPEPGVQMRGTVYSGAWCAELWSAGSCWSKPKFDRGEPHTYSGILRHRGSPRWTCAHVHPDTREARLCAAAELAGRLAAQDAEDAEDA